MQGSAGTLWRDRSSASAAQAAGKPTVESWVRFTEVHYAEALKKMAVNTPFTSIPQINEAGRQIVDTLNNRVERGRKCSRRDLFETVDKVHLNPLPEESFVCWQTLWAGQVPSDSHIRFDGHDSPVSYTHARKFATLKA